jgi:MFS family permease
VPTEDSKAQTRARESRWAVPVGIASILGVILLVLAKPLSVNGDGSADFLREAHANAGAVVLSGLMQALAFLLLALPLVYLFRAVGARSDRVRPQLIGLIVAAPLFLAASSGLSIGVTDEGADTFAAGDADSTLTATEAREECSEEREDEGVDFLVDEYDPAPGESPQRACQNRKVEDDEASNALTESSLAPLATGLGLAGALGFAVALLYTGLWAMRTGVLSRFWGSLGMVAGVAVLLGPVFLLVTLVFFVYFGLLALGLIPGGRPPAWEAAEAISWPTPGERAAAEMEPEGGWEEPDDAGEDAERATPPDRR